MSIPTDNKIGQFIHCPECMAEWKPALQALPDVEELPQRLSVGYTKIGLQVWCETHNRNVLHIDFAGNKFIGTTEKSGG